MLRIAMWSGPRNVSTALMRSFEARGDCAVVDEPLYAAYLKATGADHPGRDEILKSQPTDPEEVLARLAEPSHDLPLQFEKHMAQHWQRDWPLEAFGDGVRHAFLIREPAAVLESYARVRGQPSIGDLGTLQQAEILDEVGANGQSPVVVDGDELRAHPEVLLEKLCAALGIEFLPRMLSWPAGPRSTDGVWAKYWYSKVESSVGFEAGGSAKPQCPPELAEIAAQMRPNFERLAALRLRPSTSTGSS